MMMVMETLNKKESERFIRKMLETERREITPEERKMAKEIEFFATKAMSVQRTKDMTEIPKFIEKQGYVKLYDVLRKLRTDKFRFKSTEDYNIVIERIKKLLSKNE